MKVQAKCIMEAWDSTAAVMYVPGMGPLSGGLFELDLSKPNHRKLADLKTPRGKWIFEFDRAGSSDPATNLFFCKKCGKRFDKLNEIGKHSREVHKEVVEPEAPYVAMLTRIYIDNFRCFVNFEYRPERKQLLLGANGSGKSSLLGAIRDLKQFVKGDENPFTQSTRTRWQDRPLQVFEIEAYLDKQKYEYRLEIQFAQETRQPSVNLERLNVSGAPVFELANGELHFFPNDSQIAVAVKWQAGKSSLHLSQLSNTKVGRFVEWMENSVYCFSIDAYPGKMDESADSEEREPDYELENFAGWYRYLVQAYPVENAGFLNSMKEALDGFQALRFPSGERGVRDLLCDFSAPGKKSVPYAIFELSEGQRQLLALYMILHFKIAKGSTIFIDEPDNFVSLREIQPWLLAAEEAVEDSQGQLILVSHHPEILNQWAAKHGLRFFREDNGHVRTEKFKVDPKGDLQPSELIARGWEDA